MLNRPGFDVAGADGQAMLELGPIWLTLQLAGATTAVLVVLGTPLAWWLATTKARAKPVVEALTA